MGDGIIIKSLDKVKLQITLAHDNGTNLYATAHEYASANLLLRLFEEGHVRKPIVFCPNASSCRRLMALFMALLRRNSETLKESNPSLDNDLSSIVCGHVYQSESKGGEKVGEQPLHVRQHLIGEYLTSKFAVLFNTNLLSTGIDFPCCDGVLLTSPTKDLRTLMQRWGRSLRYVNSNPNKKGYLAMVSTDPYESVENVKDLKKQLGIDKMTVVKNDQAVTEAQFDAMYRIAECAADTSRRSIGLVFSLIKSWTITAKVSGSWKTGEKNTKKKSLVDILLMTKAANEAVILLTPEHEKIFTAIFKSHTVNLLHSLPWSVRYDACEAAMRENNAWPADGQPLKFRGRTAAAASTEESGVFARRGFLLKVKTWDSQCQEFDARFPANGFKAAWNKEREIHVSDLGKRGDNWQAKYDAYSELVKERGVVRRYPAGKNPLRKLTEEEEKEAALYTWHGHISDVVNSAGSKEKYYTLYPSRAALLDAAEWWYWQHQDQAEKELEIFRENAIACDKFVVAKGKTPKKSPAGRSDRELIGEEQEEKRLGTWLGNTIACIKANGGREGFKENYRQRFDILIGFTWWIWDQDPDEEFLKILVEIDLYLGENPHLKQPRCKPCQLNNKSTLSPEDKKKYEREKELGEWYNRLRTQVNKLGKEVYAKKNVKRAQYLSERETTWWRWYINPKEDTYNNNIKTVCEWYPKFGRQPSRNVGGQVTEINKKRRKKRVDELTAEENAERNAAEALRRIIDEIGKEYTSRDDLASSYPEVAQQLDAAAWWKWDVVNWKQAGKNTEAILGEEAVSDGN